MGTAHSLDGDDYQPNGETPHLDIIHRPETDTPIKNGTQGERPDAISSGVCQIIDDYLGHRQPDVTDGNGREPAWSVVDPSQSGAHESSSTPFLDSIRATKCLISTNFHQLLVSSICAGANQSW